jgi:hypothetical protein
MRILLTLALLFGFATAASAKPKLDVTDEKLPLQELRPLDRRVYVLSLDGNWHEAPAAKAVYYVNMFFPDGGSYAHRALEDELFRKGEVRCVIQGYQLIRHGIKQGGKFSIAISEGKAVDSPSAPEVVSNVMDFHWPMERRISRFRTRTRHTPPEPPDAFPIPGEEEANPAPPAKPKPAPPKPKADSGRKT